MFHLSTANSHVRENAFDATRSENEKPAVTAVGEGGGKKKKKDLDNGIT